MNIPMITDREELITTLIATVAPVERGVTVTVGAVIQLHHQHVSLPPTQGRVVL